METAEGEARDEVVVAGRGRETDDESEFEDVDEYEEQEQGAITVAFTLDEGMSIGIKRETLIVRDATRMDSISI